MAKRTAYGFRGRYGFLSNMSILETPIKTTDENGDPIYFKSVEHFFQAMKTLDYEERRYVAALPNPGDAKRYCKSDIVLRDDWEDIQLNVMWTGICWKFSERNPTLLKKLLDTKDLVLLEANHWGDRKWGIDWETGLGENLLGRLLMKRREQMKGKDDESTN